MVSVVTHARRHLLERNSTVVVFAGFNNSPAATTSPLLSGFSRCLLVYVATETAASVFMLCAGLRASNSGILVGTYLRTYVR